MAGSGRAVAREAEDWGVVAPDARAWRALAQREHVRPARAPACVEHALAAARLTREQREALRADVLACRPGPGGRRGEPAAPGVELALDGEGVWGAAGGQVVATWLAAHAGRRREALRLLGLAVRASRQRDPCGHADAPPAARVARHAAHGSRSRRAREVLADVATWAACGRDPALRDALPRWAARQWPRLPWSGRVAALAAAWDVREGRAPGPRASHEAWLDHLATARALARRGDPARLHHPARGAPTLARVGQVVARAGWAVPTLRQLATPEPGGARLAGRGVDDAAHERAHATCAALAAEEGLAAVYDGYRDGVAEAAVGALDAALGLRPARGREARRLRLPSGPWDALELARAKARGSCAWWAYEPSEHDVRTAALGELGAYVERHAHEAAAWWRLAQAAGAAAEARGAWRACVAAARGALAALERARRDNEEPLAAALAAEAETARAARALAHAVTPAARRAAGAPIEWVLSAAGWAHEVAASRARDAAERARARDAAEAARKAALAPHGRPWIDVAPSAVEVVEIEVGAVRATRRYARVDRDVGHVTERARRVLAEVA